MFDQMLESRRAGIAVASPCSLPIAVLLHVALAVAAVVASLLVIREVDPPDHWAPIILVQPRPPAEPPPSAAAAAPAARQRSSEPMEIVTPQEPFQPQNVPEVALDDVLDTGSSEPTGQPDGSTEGSGSVGGMGGVGTSIGTKDGLPWGDGDGPLRPGIGNHVTNPVLIPASKVEPDYPEVARQARLDGRVILEAVVEPDGTVGEINVLRCTRPYVGFEESAIRAVKQWRYEPATQNGRPVAVYFTVLVEFQLN
jgi:protein TonB